MEEIVMNPYFASLVISDESSDTSDKTKKTFTPFKRLKLIDTPDFFRGMNGTHMEREILPRNCRIVHDLPNTSEKIVVIEEEPGVRNLRFAVGFQGTLDSLKNAGYDDMYQYLSENVKSRNGEYTLQVSMPFVVVVMFIQNYIATSVQVFFRMRPLTSYSDSLYYANLLNIPDSQYICLGNRPPSYREPDNLYDACTIELERFWNTAYNMDYYHNYKMYERDVPEVCNPLVWHYNTVIDPMFIYTVPWIIYPKTIGETIDDMAGGRTQGIPSYDKLREIFYRPIKAQTRHKTHYKNTAQELAIKNSYLCVGDNITIGKKEYIVASFVGTPGHRPTRVILQGADGKTTEVSITQKFKNEIQKQRSASKEVKSVQIGDQKISTNDLIVIKSRYAGKIFKKVHVIRVARDGKIEARLGSDYYLLENLEFDVVDMSNVEVNGIKVDANKTYVILKADYGQGPTFQKYDVKLDSFDSNGANMRALFKNVMTGSRIAIDLNPTGTPVYKLSDSKDTYITPPVFRYADSLVTNWKDGGVDGYGLIPGEGIVAYDGGGYYRDYKRTTAKSNILSEDKTEIHIPSFDGDIYFKVGDAVVHADWNNPENMLKVCTIALFKEQLGSLYIVMTTLDGKEVFETEFIDFERGRIRPGTVRHIVAKWDKWKAGDKLRAKVGRIPAFPKKDVNTIVGFLPDTGRDIPQILMSNGCTLWMDEETMNNFEVLRRGTAACAKQKNAPMQLDKIKWQPGDLVVRDGSIGMINRHEGRRSLRVTVTERRAGFTYNYPTRKNLVRYGFLIPRRTQQHQYMGTGFPVFPNFHGWYTVAERSPMHVSEDVNNV